MEAFGLYKWSPLLTITFFDITPYKQIISWYRPEYTLMETVFDSANSVPDFWDLHFAATYSVSLLQLTAEFKEEAKTLKYSIMDLILNPTTYQPYPKSLDSILTDATYSDASIWVNKILGINFFKLFGLDLSAWKYYGKEKYWYRFSLLNEANNAKDD